MSDLKTKILDLLLKVQFKSKMLGNNHFIFKDIFEM